MSDDTPPFPVSVGGEGEPPSPPAGHATTAPAPRPNGRRRRRRRWWRWWLGAALAVAALAAGVAVVALGGAEDGDGDDGGGGGGVPATEPATDAPPAPAPSPEVSTPSSPPVLSLPDFFSVPELTAPVTTAGENPIPPPGAGPDDLGADARLDRLAEECFAGEMQACDDLYLDAPGDSGYETYGDTCAGRQPANTRRFCTDVFGGA